MSEPTRFCPACYATNRWAADECRACGALLRSDESYDDRLIWALDHPDTGIAMTAAQVLAARHASAAIDALVRILASPEPHRAAAAAAALLALQDDDRAMAAVEAAKSHPSVLVRCAVAGSAGQVQRTAAGAEETS